MTDKLESTLKSLLSSNIHEDKLVALEIMRTERSISADDVIKLHDYQLYELEKWNPDDMDVYLELGRIIMNKKEEDYDRWNKK